LLVLKVNGTARENDWLLVINLKVVKFKAEIH
jgi:hypothetical protein